MKKTGMLTGILLSIVWIIGCTKTGTSPVPPTAEKNASIVIKLNNNYLPAEKIDSAVLSWEINGKLHQESMHLSNDTLSIKTKSLDKGDGMLTLQLFTSVRLRERKLQWEKRWNVNLKAGENIHVPAPVSFEDNGWFPRIIMLDPPNRFTAIVALRPDDAYFFMKDIPTGFKIELERNYVATPGGAVIIGGGLWQCNTVCTDAKGVIENREFFRPLAERMNGRTYKMVEVGIGLFGNNSMPGPGFYFNHW
jgi:hypothetical protein